MSYYKFCWSSAKAVSKKSRWNSSSSLSTSSGKRIGKKVLRLGGVLTGMIGGCAMVLHFLDESSVKALEGVEIELPSYPWGFHGVLKAFDHSALRRGWLVYRTVCHTCHSLRYVKFLDLVETTHSVEEATATASEFEVEDGPDDEGNMYTRSCKLTDRVPDPYPNEQAARAANSGAYPPDLSNVVFSRYQGIDFLFSLLTGWMEPPAGIQVAEGQYFNVYFPGGFVSMPSMLFSGMLEYDDGTPATESQMAKDVVEFLTWTAAQEHDMRKIMTLKGIGLMLILLVPIAHIYRRYWSHLRSRRIAYVPNYTTGVPRSSKSPAGSKKGDSLPSR
ncbi:Cytochrome c1-2, heme protein, mitochondrial [Habropoda laboriosa]|uniref:Cytochrome c1-2, heme protein, mitochondrial n=1 Tax=Habropoda laboriosa TaxID=597456 RepID=A0A0L7QVD0_9HYME|nr:Cytochrome c1-2, heme protein, mitochondrial [Habropoda laboriosa]